MPDAINKIPQREGIFYMHHILLSHRITPNDLRFVTRWEALGKAYLGKTTCPELIDIWVVDHSMSVQNHDILQYPNLKYIVCPQTQPDCIHADLDRFGIVLISMKDEYEIREHLHSVSEYILRTMLAMARPGFTFGSLLREKDLGIIGYGRIGRQLAYLAEGFNMGIFRIDKDTPKDTWRECFGRSDYIAVCLPDDDSTVMKVSKELINLMKPTANLISISRPRVIDIDALMLALNENRIAGATLDILDRGHTCVNLSVTAHIAGSTTEDRITTDEFCLGKLKERIRLSDNTQKLRRWSLRKNWPFQKWTSKRL